MIKEIYDDPDSYEKFIAQLDKALYEHYETIIIEPQKVGDETARWIRVGNCLHKTAFVSGLGSIAFGLICPRNFHISGPLCIISTFCSAVYWISWSFDPCVKYQVETNPIILKTKIQSYSEFSSPTVLKYKELSKVQRYLHQSVCLLSMSFMAYRVYKAVVSN